METMNEAVSGDSRPIGPSWAHSAANWLGGIVFPASSGLAIVGGLVLLGFMTISVGSIASRVLFGAPLLGDYELVERGSAIAIFCVLPYTHVKGGNVTVEMFVGMMPHSMRRFVALVAEIGFAVVIGVISWRLVLGGIEMYEYRDSSMMLQIPTWWIFVPIVASSIMLTLVCIQRFLSELSGNPAPSGGEL